ncbi:MAG: hypothetical protein KatS3mg030_624 [Saprospiraceae bacterium]|jgi:CBS domain-containing protein|nr:MAG: hypothetical protein KatS3mg029_0476 [Saprospiraceae bacterium]GIV32322.1 MAG: hypothetical protein KatS3mg030_624 [Saprospiraceae bacterium]
MMNERLSAIMTRDVVTVSPEDTLDRVKELLFKKRIHHLPVVEGKKLVGIVTSWDLIKSQIEWKDYGKTKVKDIMTKNVATLGPNELIGAAAMIFLKNLFHGLPITDDEGNLLGIVTTHDILLYEYNKEYPNDPFIKDTNWLVSP